jgi:hypothetical protein
MSLPVLDKLEMSRLAAIVHYVNKSAVRAEARSSPSTVLTINRLSTHNMTDYISVVAHKYRGIYAIPCGLEPFSLLGMEMLGWTTHGIRDDEEGEYTLEQVKRLASKAGWVLLTHEKVRPSSFL